MMKHRSIKIYGGSAALTVDAQVPESGAYQTIIIEAARKIQSRTTYNWNEKTVVQVTDRELPVVLATLLGYQDQCEFNYHGKGHNKSYAICAQIKGVLMTLSSARNGIIRVPVGEADTFALSTLVMMQLQRNYGGLPSDVLLTLLTRSFCERSAVQHALY